MFSDFQTLRRVLYHCSSMQAYVSMYHVVTDFQAKSYTKKLHFVLKIKLVNQKKKALKTTLKCKNLAIICPKTLIELSCIKQALCNTEAIHQLLDSVMYLANSSNAAYVGDTHTFVPFS